MPLSDFLSNDPSQNQTIINILTVDELRELSNLKELRISNIATRRYFEEREEVIFTAARARVPKEGLANEVD